MLGFGLYELPRHKGTGGKVMATAKPNNTRYPNAVWAERKQDLLLVSSFGMWACLLGLSPVLAVHFLVGA